MKHHFASEFTAALSTLLLLIATPAARSQLLPDGQYRCVVAFGDVLLVGHYPFEVTGLPAGTIKFITSAAGTVTAEILVVDEKEEATGNIRLRNDGIRLALKGRIEEGRVRVDALLQGSAFVGTATIRGQTAPCRIEVGGIAPIRAEYTLALTSSGNGRLTGHGMLKVEQETIPVKVRGGLEHKKLSLTIKGGNTSLKAKSGTLTSTGFSAAKWTAQGFGALTKGVNLQVESAAP